MRARLIATITMIATFASIATARADTQIPDHQFSFPFMGTIPCGEAGTCPDDQIPQQIGSELCHAPFPASVASADTTPAPQPPDGKRMILSFTITPEHDWGAFVCDDAGRAYFPGDILGEVCENELGSDNPLPFGCIQDVDVPASAGAVFHLHAINRLDWTDCPAIYRFVFV